MKRILFIWIMAACSMWLSAQAKYVFYFIGDGMGPNQVLLAEMYRSALQGEPLGRVRTHMSRMPYAGHVSTHSASNGITDSAASGTCLATGTKTKNGMLGLTPDSTRLTTIAEELKAKGWGIGIMTTVAIDHATPAAFYAHVPKRNQYYTVGQQLSESGFDFFGGAGFHHPQGKKNDQEINLYRLAEKRGYTIAHGYAEAVGLQIPEVNKMILIQREDDQGANHGDNLWYAIDREEDELTLKQIVGTAIPFLDSRYDKFFMMVEGGMVDYACHGKDAATAIGEVWDMDEALGVAMEFYRAHPDETLIVVTADHETGGLALGNSDYTLHLEMLQHQKCSGWVLHDQLSSLFEGPKRPTWSQVKNIYRERLGFWDTVDITDGEEYQLRQLYKAACSKWNKNTKSMYKTVETMTAEALHLLNKKAHVGWTTYAHTAHSVPVFAIGVGAEQFTGWLDNTEIVPAIRKAIGE